MAQSVEHLTSVQVMISWFVGLSPMSGSVLTAQSLEPASDSVSPSLSTIPLLTLCLSVCLSQNINKHLKKKKLDDKLKMTFTEAVFPLLGKKKR